MEGDWLEKELDLLIATLNPGIGTFHKVQFLMEGGSIKFVHY